MPTQQQTECPSCGTKSKGTFCSGCGARLDQAFCSNCGASLSAAARFCHICGATRSTSDKRSAELLPWIIAGSALVILVLVLVVRVPSSQPGQSPEVGAPASATSPAPDISQMTPREQADRLFDRVMIAAEQGDTVGALEFASKTVTAYGMVGVLDPDARYHLGLVHGLQGNQAAAVLQADSIEASAPGHLFVDLIRYRIAEITRDTSAMLGVYRRFLENYDREIATARSEYELHRNTIDAFRDEARRVTASNQ